MNITKKTGKIVNQSNDYEFGNIKPNFEFVERNLDNLTSQDEPFISTTCDHNKKRKKWRKLDHELLNKLERTKCQEEIPQSPWRVPIQEFDEVQEVKTQYPYFSSSTNNSEQIQCMQTDQNSDQNKNKSCFSIKKNVKGKKKWKKLDDEILDDLTKLQIAKESSKKNPWKRLDDQILDDLAKLQIAKESSEKNCKSSITAASDFTYFNEDFIDTQKSSNIELDTQYLKTFEYDTNILEIPENVKPNYQILKNLLFENCCLLLNVNQTKVFSTEILEPGSKEYKNINGLFTSTKKNCYLQKIEKVYNPFLLLQYNIKKQSYQMRNDCREEKILFHGTQKCNINDICTTNLNWRLYGSYTGCKYGQGVSFSSLASYAAYYGDTEDNVKIMIAAKVLIGKCCVGNEDTIIPPSGFDTSTDELQQVFVKYEDNDFYPAYIIYYEDNEGKEDRKRSVAKDDREEWETSSSTWSSCTLVDFFPDNWEI